jgi:hypothetical protein
MTVHMMTPPPQRVFSKHRPSYFTPKKKFSPREDELLAEAVEALGTADWRAISKAVKSRNARQCRERWTNYLDPRVAVREPWTDADDVLLLEKFEELGPKWIALTEYFPGRSTNTVKNRWITLSHGKKPRRPRGAGRVFRRPIVPMITPALPADANADPDADAFVPSNDLKDDFEFALGSDGDPSNDWNWFDPK